MVRLTVTYEDGRTQVLAFTDEEAATAYADDQMMGMDTTDARETFFYIEGIETPMLTLTSEDID